MQSSILRLLTIAAAGATLPLSSAIASQACQPPRVIVVANLAQSDDDQDEEQAEAARDSAETAQEAAEDSLEQLQEAAEDARESACEESRHCGGAGAIGIQLVWLNKEPLKALARKDRDLRVRDFSFTGDPTPMIGFMGHHESSSGFRGGMSLWAGYQSFDSREYPADQDTATHDSLTILRFVPVYCGFNFDKVFHVSRFSFSLGGMLGGGAYLLFMKEYDLDESAAFSTVDEKDTLRTGDANVGFAWAPMMTGEVRAGTMISLAPRFHVGLDAFLLLNYAPEGFDVATGGFASANPGLRLKLVLGKA